MTRHLCMDCGAALSGDEIALHKKIICRAAEQYYCMDCLAAFCSTSRERLEQLVSYYHRTGESDSADFLCFCSIFFSALVIASISASAPCFFSSISFALRSRA